MIDKIRQLKTKKYAATIIIGLLLVFVLGLFTLLSPSIKNIKIDRVLTKTTALNASVDDAITEEVVSNNYDEIKYQLKVNKDKSDTAIITGTLTNKENKYARFKEMKDAVVSDNGKTITVTTTRSKVTITVVISNAPYGTSINPKFNINSEDESKSKIDVDPVVITGKSVEGKIYDEDGTFYKGLELSLNKNSEEVKRTYTRDNGEYVFSLGDVDTYEVKLEEDKYQIVRYTEETVDENRRILNIVIKEVEPFNLEIKKTISKLDLVVNGKKESYDYDDETKVVKSIKNAETIEGSIYYNISIKNTGDIKGTLTVLKDIIPDGLSFDENKNPGWTKNGKYIYYTVVEGKEIEPFGKLSATLVLDIVKTNEAKTYINTAIASGDDYKYVAYYLNNQLFKEEYVIASEKIQNIDPNVENFGGWYTDKEFTNKYNFDNQVLKDTVLFGKINNKKYNVTFIDINPNTDEETILDIQEVNEGASASLVDTPTYNGYTFKCFKLNDECYESEEITEDVNLYTSYTVNQYDITYDLDGGSLEEDNPSIYTVKYGITLNNPTKEGFTFIGWTGTGLSEPTLEVTIPAGSTGDREYTANYEINKSTLTVDPNGGTYLDNSSSVSYTKDYGTILQIVDSVRRGYKFDGYAKTGGGTFSNGTYTFDNDDATLTANYTIITYRIRYENITDTERATLNNPIIYDVESGNITLKNPGTRLDDDGNNYQDFLGWDDGNGNVSEFVTIPSGSIGDKTYTAVWKENDDSYAITYNLNGGSLPQGVTNPNTYTRQTDDFEIHNPTKTGYIFLGWSGTGIEELSTNVIVRKGSAGKRTYTAYYQVIPYIISYNGLTESEIAAANNPSSYTVETETISLTPPSRNGYTFLGWSGTDIADKSVSVTIPQGSTGNRVYTAHFKKLEYSLTYTYNGGVPSEENPEKYSIDSSPITLHNPTKTGYTFKGWSGTDLVGNENTEVTIPTGSTGHRSFLANYTPITYHITYDYNGGSLEEGTTNPTEYTIESPNILFNNPSKEGYIFTNYTFDGNAITSIPTGTIGDIDLVANYEIRKYTVNYYNENSIFSTETVDWNSTTTRPSTDPTKAHHVFLYWTEDGENEYNFNTAVKTDKNLYAVYEEVIAPEISVSPTLDDTTNKTWVCGDSTNNNCGVTVTVSSEHSDYELYYKVGDGPATLYTEPFKVYENTTVTAWSKKSNVNSVSVEDTIDNVDTIAPTINQPWTGAMSFNITVNGTMQDASSGIKKYTMYAKEKSALVYDDTFTYVSPDFDGLRDHSEDYAHTFYNVQDDTEYIVKIVAEDYVGNTSELEVEVKTNPYVARVVGKNGILWYTVDPDTKEMIVDEGKEFLLFDSIQSAVNYCANIQCTIQTNPILPVVNESVTIGDNQDITIDLDGRGIISTEEATFINNGKLQIVDRNPREDESIGFVNNTVNKAIVNNNILVVGDGSSEPSEIFINPELDRPIIYGKVTGIEQNKEFHFYDGKIKSDSLAITDNGDDVITQYSYNVVITEEDDFNIATMARVTDPEARIRSTYYQRLNVKDGGDAFDTSNSGIVTKTEQKLLSKIKQAGDYGFVYDEVNDEIYSGNSSTYNTTALSYLKLDLTNYAAGKYLLIDAFADTYNSNSYGYVSVSEEFGNQGTRILKTTGNDAIGTQTYYLEKGKVYYIYFGFIKAGNDINKYETFRITNFQLLGEKEETSEIKMYGSPDHYQFAKQDDGSYASTNTGINNSYSHSYIMYDLRNIDTNIDIIFNYSISSQLNGDFGYIYVTDNANFQEYNNTNNRYVYVSGTVTDKTKNITLTAGKMNYVHFGYFKNGSVASGDDTFKINSISLSNNKSEDLIPESTITHDSNYSYYFEKTDYDIYHWKDTSGNERHANVTGIYDTVKKGYRFTPYMYGYVPSPNFSLTDYEETVYIEYSTTSTQSNKYFYNGSTNERITLQINNDRIYVSNTSDYNVFLTPSGYNDGQKHSFMVTYKDGVYDLYYDGTALPKNSGKGCRTAKNANVYIGARHDISSGNYLGATIYDVKVFDKVITTEELDNTENLLLHLDGNDAKLPNTGDITYISNNYNVKSSVAHSYLTYDLTNVNEDKYLYVNTSISSRTDRAYGYVQITDSPNYPSDSTGREISTSGEKDNVYTIFRLPKNKVSYIHFIYTKDANEPVGADRFVIKEVKLVNKLEDAYSVNADDYSKIDTMYLEKPVLNQKVDTIEMLKTITLDTPIVIPQEKEVVLDLNGFTLTSSANDYIIKNSGKLTIKDSKYDELKAINVDYATMQAEMFEQAKIQYLADLAEYQEYAGLCDGCTPSKEYKIDNTATKIYSYEDFAQEYKAYLSGDYKVELWGASGATNDIGGKGAYTSGIITLNEGDKLYVYTGEQSSGFNATYNGGGGCTNNCTAGGGATDVRLVDGSWNDATSLSSRIMVAAGGAGYNAWQNGYVGGAGGALTGINGAGDSPTTVATQTSGAISYGNVQNMNGTFGIGGYGDNWGGGGSGGYWGGAGGKNSSTGNGGSGGSSYISGYLGSVAIRAEDDLSPRLINNNTIQCTDEIASENVECSYHYSGKIFTDGVMKSGAEEMPNYNDDTTMVGNLGNGYARISYNVSPEELEEMRNNLEKTYTVKEEPKFIDYLDGIDFDGTVNINQLTPESTPSYSKTVEEVRNGKIVSTIANIIINEEDSVLILQSGKIDLNVNSKIAIENRGSLVINDAIINVNNSSDIGVFNETNGSIAFTGEGSINAVGSSSTGLLNRSNTPAILNAKVTTTPTNAVGIKNNAICDIAFDNMNLSGAGVAFSEHSTGNTIINNSNLKSTGNSSLISYPQGAQSKLQITNSNFSGQLTVYDSRKKVEITNSSLTTLLNSYGNVKIYESNLASINNSGDTVIDKSVITGSGTVITNSATGSSNYAYTRRSARTSRMLLTNSTINSTANKNTSVTVMSNMDTMTIKDTVINNINQNTSATAITNDHLWIANDYNLEFNSYLNISGNITIDSTFGTAINNTGVVTLGSKINNISTEYDYAYTGHQEEFVAPVTGEYKLETWGAGGIGSGFQIMLGGPGGYASGTISLNEGDKLYIHVGGVGSIGMSADYLIGNTRDFHSGNQGSYNGGSPIVWRNSEAIYGAGGGATDISLSSEDNTWSYNNGILTSTRSAASYNQRILVAGGGSGCVNSTSCAGGYNVDPSTSRLGYGTNSGGGGYYGGTYNIGGSSYASSALSNVLLLDGNKEIPDYNSVSGIIKGSRGNGYARITLLDDSPDTVISSPNITATNYGITGNGKLYFYDGTIEANVAVNATIDEVTDDYDIYVKHGTKETMTLVANENSRPVEEGQEEFACKIGNAKYTTINNALEASNNGDIIELLVNIEQQNQIVIPQNKIITIDYKGHTVKSYNPDALYKNYGNLTITDSTNALNKNTFTGKEYIYNEGTLALSRVYLYNNAKNTYIIENNDGIVTMDSVKIDVGADNSEGKVGINNSANGVVTAQNSTFSMWYNNKMFNNYGTLEVKNSTVNNHLWTANHFYNNATGTLVLDGNTFTVDGHGGNGRGFLTNVGTATIKNMTTNIEKISNTGKLILEGNNNIPSGILDSTGLVIVNAGTYKNTFNINNGGKSIDNTEDLYSFIMNYGTINTKLNLNTTKISSIKGGTISVASGSAINNTAAGTINLGIKDGTVLNKDNTKPVITGKTYGIYTSVPALVVNFYDGIISGNKAYNVTIREVETGYSIHRDYDDTNNIETKYLTSEPLFKNVTHTAEYNSISELNTALSNGSIVDDDVIQVYRDITITNNDNAITIPNGLKITFDINGKIVDKNNNTMFIVNGELDAVDTVISSTGKIDSTVGDIFSNNGTINALSGTYISEKANVESTVFKNNSTGTLNVIGGTFTKYYDSLGYRSFNSGSIIDNYGNTVVTGGDFYANSSLTLYYYSKSGIPDKGANAISGVNYLYSSAVFMNEQSGTLNVTGGNFDGITGKTWNDLNVAWSDPSWDNKGELIYNYGTATIKGITSYNTHIGRNDGTLTLDTVVMPNIYQMQAQFGHGGTFPNLINKGDIYLKNSEFTVLAQFAENYGNMYITDTIIDRTGNSSYYNATLPDSWQQGSGHKNSHVIRNYYNSLSDNILSISDSYIYNKGSGEVIDNRGKVDIEDSTLEASNNTVITNTSAILNVKGDSSVVSQSGSYSGVTLTSSSIFTLGEPIEVDGEVSQTKPLIKGVTYGINNSGSTFNFYDGLIEGKTLAFNGTFSSLESGYTVMYDTDGDYKSNYLDRIPIIQNVTQATASDEKKYYDLKTAFEEANDNDTLKMIADYSSLPTDETAVNDHIVTFDLNGKVLRQSNNVLIQNTGTLNFTDDSQNADGNLIFLSGTNVLRNDGTLNIIGGKISTAKADVTLIKNNSGATLNIRDNAKITSSTNTYLIDNSGTTNITNGAYLHTIGRNIIINRSILNVIDLNNDDDENTSSDLRAPIMNDEVARGYGTRYYHHGIYSTSNSTTTIYGGIFNNGETYDTGSPSTSIIIYNEGTATIKNLESYAGLIGDNTGTLTIEKSHFYNSYWRMIINSGTLRFDDVEIEITDNTNQGRISTAGTAIFNNVRIKGRNENTTYGGPLLDSYGNLSIENSSINVKLSNEMMYNSSTLNIKDTNINGNYGIDNRGNLTLDHTNITTSNYAISSDVSGTINVKNISTLHSTNANAVALRGSIKLNVIGENTIISDNGIGISLADSTTLNIGEIGGTPDTDTPYIEGTTYGVYNGSLTTTLNFYDGRVVGRTGPNAIYGVLNNVEAEFEPTTVLITDPDTNIGKYNEYLVRSANSVVVAKVGNYSFASVGSISPSRALQNAINFAIGDGSNVKDVDLTSVDIDLVTDEYSITASMPVTINLNNHTINQNSTYNLSSNITLNNNTGVGASISKLLGNVFSTGNSSKDIVIYELSDGSKLDTTKTYKLYKDGKVISLEKEELGRYKYKGNNEDLTPIKGRLYLDNLSKGSYKLLSSDNKSIEFSIDSDGNISGNVTENTKDSSESSAIANSEAELILQIQTGKNKYYYWLLIIPIVLIIGLLIIVNKNKKRES